MVTYAQSSFAWFKVCNGKSDGADMWVTYAYYVPHENTVTYFDSVYDCPVSTNENPESGGGCYWSAWKNVGWWYLTPGGCATVYGPALTNRYSYVYANITDGSKLNNANYSDDVITPAFSLDQRGGMNFVNGNCAASNNSPNLTCNEDYWVNTAEVDTGSFSNYTLTIN
jgi:hypothetical protein